MDELLTKCGLIKNAFKIDVEAIDENFETILHISNDNEPLIITEARKGIYPDLQNALFKAKKNSFCFYTDSFQLSYVAIAINEEEQYNGMTIVGPFLNDRVSDSFMWKVLKDNHLENSWLKPLESFYKGLIYLGESFLPLAEVLVNILRNPLVNSQIITTKSSNAERHSEMKPQDLDQDGMDIKLRYEAEKKFFHLIEIGDKERALETMAEYTGDFLYRVPGNPLRARKNLTFSSNSMYRITAARGGVPPQYLHAISEKFALKIEEAVTMSELNSLEIAMTEEYCDAVRDFSIKGHSVVVKEALMYINLHSNDPINLQSVADEIGYNRTYLAKKFKEEMNISVIDYIHQKRIDEAAFLIEQGRSSITDISYMTGFSSYNYFCKVFKDIKGITATEYKNGKRADA